MGNLLDMMRFRSGPTRFEALVRPHIKGLYRAAYRFVGNSADADDLVQDVLFKVYSKRDKLKKVDKLRPWLMTVLYRAFIDKTRRDGRSRLVLVSSVKQGDENVVDFFEATPSPDPGPGEITERMYTGERIKKALAELNEDQRSLCVLHDMEGFTLSELADILDTPMGTLQSRLHRARVRLRKLLSDGLFEKDKASFLNKG